MQPRKDLIFLLRVPVEHCHRVFCQILDGILKSRIRQDLLLGVWFLLDLLLGLLLGRRPRAAEQSLLRRQVA